MNFTNLENDVMQIVKLGLHDMTQAILTSTKWKISFEKWLATDSNDLQLLFDIKTKTYHSA